MGLGPIPRSKIREYARDVLDLRDDAYERFFDVIVHVDSDYVSMHNEVKDQSSARVVVAIDDAAGVKNLFDRLEQAPKRSKSKQPQK